jgi:hypothetical protein
VGLIIAFAGATLALQVQQSVAPPRLPEHPPVVPRTATERALIDSLESAMLLFFRDWSDAWRFSEMERRRDLPMEGGIARARHVHLHCHPNQDVGFAGVRSPNMIRSVYGWYAVCPVWSLGDEAESMEERVYIDTVLSPPLRAPVKTARNALVAAFASAVRRFPENNWFIGQQVRLLLDNRDAIGALHAAQSCVATSWWCRALRGAVLNEQGEVIAAEAAFDSASAGMPFEDRCRWNDLSVFFPPVERTEYQKAACAARSELNERIWWLADPLYLDPGNARRAEHFARLVFGMLRSALNRDERYDWRARAGGDALANMVARFGWPSYASWAGVREDVSHSGYLIDHETALNEPYTTFEYSSDRIHTVPTWRAIMNPMTARASDWELSNPYVRFVLEDTTVRLWWPREHFKPREPLVQLPQGQVAFLRRQTDVIFASATDLALPELRRPFGDGVAPTVFLTTSAADIRPITTEGATVGGVMVLRPHVDSRRQLVSIEFPAKLGSSGTGGRIRFGIAPPPPLSAMARGERASSDPVILRAPADPEVLPSNPPDALDRMAPYTRAPATGRIGVYWETYGFQPSDTVDVAVWIERYTPQGIARRLGIALNVAEDLNTPIVIRWSEPRAGLNASYIAGPVPIVGRSLVLDVSRLAKGDYWLDVAVAKRGQPPVRGRRSFAIQ